LEQVKSPISPVDGGGITVVSFFSDCCILFHDGFRCVSECLYVNVVMMSGRDFIAPCKCKGSGKYVHRECLDNWRSIKEGFAFCHCTTCKVPYHIRVHVPADRKWRTLKFRFFVTRDILVIFAAVQLVH